MDLITGKTLTFLLSNNSDYESLGRTNYIITKTYEDCLIFGSSKASHHYVPKIISDSINIESYNCGQDGNGIYFVYPTVKTILSRYNPKLIIYDIKPEFDIYKYESNERYLSVFKGFYGKNEIIDSIICALDGTQKYKQMSLTYNFNSSITSPIVGYINRNKRNANNGLLPLYGNFKGEINSKTNYDSIDETKIKLLKKLCDFCKDKTRLVFIVSPSIYTENIQDYEPIINLCKEFNLPFLFYGNEKDFVGNREYFKDPVHLNYNGAIHYTKKIVQDIKSIL